ncbi:MAG: deaminase [Gaiellaceae bacterium MAG52_C11]|nr:deaminase [Candidatus Gaiellasilicea maunaloa]
MVALDSLAPAWGEVFDLMWEAYLAGSIPVGAVVADAEGTIVARGRNRIFDAAHAGQLAGTRLGHAEVNALVGLSSERTYDELTLFTALEPCHLCLAAATTSRIGRLSYAAVDLYGGAVGKLLPSEDMRAHPLVVEGPLPGAEGSFPELLHVRHMLWRVPSSNVVRLYRELRPDVLALAERLPAPIEATTLADAFANVAK